MIGIILIQILTAWLVAAVVAGAITWVRVLHHRWRCRPGMCEHCGYDLRETPQMCPECGHSVSEPAPLPTSRRLRRVLFVLLASVAMLNTGWPYVFVRPALLAEAKRDVNTLLVRPAGRDPRMVNVGEVALLGDGTRLRPISDSHHNSFFEYNGSTYVNINNRIYYRSSGHCDPAWYGPVEDLSATTEADLVQVLVRQGYRQVFP